MESSDASIGRRGRRKEKPRGQERGAGLFLRFGCASNPQTPTIGSWSRLAKSAEIDAIAPTAFPNVLFPRFLPRPASPRRFYVDADSSHDL